MTMGYSKKKTMLIFEQQYEYFFTGYANLIERVPPYVGRTDTFLGNFVEYQSAFIQGNYYDQGKAVFEFGAIIIDYYDLVEPYGLKK